jgi:hypothetical protein
LSKPGNSVYVIIRLARSDPEPTPQDEVIEATGEQ